MGERVGKAWRGVALFTVGVLVGVVLIGSGSLSLALIGDSAQAQGAAIE